MRWQSRDVCMVLEDMERCYETRNFSMMPGLIAEAKILSSRVENVLDMQHRVERLMEGIEELEKKRTKMLKETNTSDEVY